MGRKATITTLCTVCEREVGVVQSWNRWQAGQSVQWRVVRHRRTVAEGGPICTGTGIMVEAALVV